MSPYDSVIKINCQLEIVMEVQILLRPQKIYGCDGGNGRRNRSISEQVECVHIENRERKLQMKNPGEGGN